MKQNQWIMIVAGIVALFLIGNQFGLFSVQEFNNDNNKLSSRASGHSKGATQIPIFATQCSQSGYDFCDEDSYSYGSARSTAKIYWSFLDDNGRFWDNGNNRFAVGNLYYQAGFTGDKIYHFRDFNPVTSWDDVNCNENGCSGLLPVSTSKIKIASVGEEFTECMGFIAWDRDDSDGDWAWTWAGRGWVGDGDCVIIDVVECYDDSDCTGEEVCDKGGSWQSWSCEEEEEEKQTYFLEFIFLKDGKDIVSIDSNKELIIWFNLAEGVEGNWKDTLEEKEIKMYINNVFYDTFISDKNTGWVHTEFIAKDELTNGENEIKIVYEGDNQYKPTQKIKLIEMISESECSSGQVTCDLEINKQGTCIEGQFEWDYIDGKCGYIESIFGYDIKNNECVSVEDGFYDSLLECEYNLIEDKDEELYEDETFDFKEFFDNNKIAIFIIAGFLFLLLVIGGKKK